MQISDCDYATSSGVDLSASLEMKTESTFIECIGQTYFDFMTNINNENNKGDNNE